MTRDSSGNTSDGDTDSARPNHQFTASFNGFTITGLRSTVSSKCLSAAIIWAPSQSASSLLRQLPMLMVPLPGTDYFRFESGGFFPRVPHPAHWPVAESPPIESSPSARWETVAQQLVPSRRQRPAVKTRNHSRALQFSFFPPERIPMLANQIHAKSCDAPFSLDFPTSCSNAAASRLDRAETPSTAGRHPAAKQAVVELQRQVRHPLGVRKIRIKSARPQLHAASRKLLRSACLAAARAPHLPQRMRAQPSSLDSVDAL